MSGCGIYFIGLFGVVGILVTITFGWIFLESKTSSFETYIPLIVGLLFFLFAGIFFYHGLKPTVFDKTQVYFWKGWKSPRMVVNKNEIKHMARLDNIHALQIIDERVSSKNGSYLSYEINLILNNTERINIMDTNSHMFDDSTLKNIQANNLLAPYVTAAMDRYDRVASFFSIEPRRPFFENGWKRDSF